MLDLAPDVLAEIRRAQALAAEGDVAGAVAVYESLMAAVDDDDFHAASVAHMYAIVVDDPARKLEINEEALRRAERVTDGRFPEALHASLLANLGYSHLVLGEREAARHWYERAKEAAKGLDDDDYGRKVRAGIDGQLAVMDKGRDGPVGDDDAGPGP